MPSARPFPFETLPRVTRAHFALATGAPELAASARGWVEQLSATSSQAPYGVRLAATSVRVHWSARRDEALTEVVDPGGYWATLARDPNGPRTLCHLHGAVAAELVAATLGERPLGRPLHDSELVAIDVLLLEALSATHADAPARMLVRSDNALAQSARVFRRDESLVRVCVGVTAESQGRCVQGSLDLFMPLAEVPVWSRVPELEGASEETSVMAGLDGLFVLASAHLPRAALRGLEPGAVCVPEADGAPAPRDTPCLLGELRFDTQQPELRVPVAWLVQGGRWHLRLEPARGAHTGGLSVPSDAERVPASQAPEEPRGVEQRSASDAIEQALARAPVELVFELGRRHLTIDAVRRLQRGDVLDLGVAIDAPVRLRIAGRLVGLGELVDLEGNLGVRVVELYEGPETAEHGG